MTRPDLDKLVAWLKEKEKAGKYTLAHANLELLLTYCRELEAENKRLRSEGALKKRHPMIEVGPQGSGATS